MSLSDEIENGRLKIKTNSYSMSIGELINLYENDEIIINPNFQRVFRWTIEQKSSFIESILLGIPTPSMFVSQDDNGKWEVIDGLQRMSTIFDFVGVLKDEKGGTRPQSKLCQTEYLPSLEDKSWGPSKDNADNTNEEVLDSFTSRQRIDFKRSKIDVNIILRESDNRAKYDLFQRINAGGSHLTAQEVRNCLLIMTDLKFYEDFEKFVTNEDFENCIGITDRAAEERYDMELVARFITLTTYTMRKNWNVGEFLSAKLVEMAEGKTDISLGSQKRKDFDRTFKFINESLGVDAFKRYDHKKGKFLGKSQVSMFEAIAIGIGSNIEQWDPEKSEDVKDFKMKVKNIWKEPKFIYHQGRARSGSHRISRIIPFGKTYFKR